MEAFPCEGCFLFSKIRKKNNPIFKTNPLFLDPSQAATLFSFFIQKLYRHPWLSKCIPVLFVERNIAAGPYVMERIMVEQCPRRYVITDPIRDVSGWWTSRSMKSEYVISGAAQMKEDKVCFMKDLVCENPWIPSESRADMVKNKLLEELPRFKIRPAPDNSRRITPIISGKIDDNGRVVKGQNDDLAFAFFMGLYFIEGISQETIPGLDYKYIKQEGR
jgi:hypothetical protein